MSAAGLLIEEGLKDEGGNYYYSGRSVRDRCAIFFEFIFTDFTKFVLFRSVQIFESTGNSEKMNISEVSSSLENIPLPPDQKKAILQLIDAKINNDMKEVIAKLNEMEGKLEVKMQAINDRLSNEIKIVYWVIGIAMTVIMFVVARK